MENKANTMNDFQSVVSNLDNMPIDELKALCINLFNQLEKDEDGYVVFKDENNENEFLYLTEMFFNKAVLCEVIAVRFDDDGNLLLWESGKDYPRGIGVYEESKREILSKLFVMLSNQ